MTNILAPIFRLQQFVFEYGPWFLATWFGLAVTTGLIEMFQKPLINYKPPSSSFLKYRLLRRMQQFLFSLLWHHNEKITTSPGFNGQLLFCVVASVSALVVTSLIGIEIVWLRLILTALFTLSLSWFVTSIILHKSKNSAEQQADIAAILSFSVLDSQTPLIKPERLRSLAQVTWKSFIGQMDGAVISIIIGLSLASVLTIYLPVYTIRVWLGPYLAALLTIPFQLTGDAEVLLFSTTGQRDQFRNSIEHYVGCSQHNFLYDSSPLPTFESRDKGAISCHCLVRGRLSRGSSRWYSATV